MTEVDPALTAKADQAGATIREMVDEMLVAVALLDLMAQKGDDDATREAINDFMVEVMEIPPNLTAGLVFALADRLVQAGAVVIEDHRGKA